jgi:hypothetical protein
MAVSGIGDHLPPSRPASSGVMFFAPHDRPYPRPTRRRLLHHADPHGRVVQRKNAKDKPGWLRAVNAWGRTDLEGASSLPEPAETLLAVDDAVAKS